MHELTHIKRAVTIVETNPGARILFIVPGQLSVTAYTQLIHEATEGKAFHYIRGCNMWKTDSGMMAIETASVGLLQRLSGLYFTHIYLCALDGFRNRDRLQLHLHDPEGRAFHPNISLLRISGRNGYRRVHNSPQLQKCNEGQ